MYERLFETKNWKTPPTRSTAYKVIKKRSAGEQTVVLGPGWPGILLHEVIGHGLEGDLTEKTSNIL